MVQFRSCKTFNTVLIHVEMSIKTEIGSQPSLWRRAADEARAQARCLPADGARAAIVGCGTSFHMATAYAAVRQDRDKGETHAYMASEYVDRGEDHLVLLSRSGTTSEILHLARSARTPQVSAITATADAPLASTVPACAVLGYADEESVVQTRFATTCLALLLAGLGEDLSGHADDAEQALSLDFDESTLAARRYVFLGARWAYGLANEAALKLAEMSLSWAEAHNPFEFRHGPVALTERTTVLIPMAEEGMEVLRESPASKGSVLPMSGLSPLARLVTAQRLGLALARRRGLDPANPDGLSRAVILDDTQLSVRRAGTPGLNQSQMATTPG